MFTEEHLSKATVLYLLMRKTTERLSQRAAAEHRAALRSLRKPDVFLRGWRRPNTEVIGRNSPYNTNKIK